MHPHVPHTSMYYAPLYTTHQGASHALSQGTELVKLCTAYTMDLLTCHNHPQKPVLQAHRASGLDTGGLLTVPVTQ